MRWLWERAKSGTYDAPPVRRVHIPKGTGPETRPIGIPTFEDKVLQRAVVMVLEAVYEQDFYNCSYGFRPGRSAHQALDGLWQQTMRTQGGWIVEVDIRKFFDKLDHAHLRELLRLRIRGRGLLQLHASSDRTDSGAGSTTGSFDLLGFTHFWARSRKGIWVVKRSTAPSRLRRAISTIAQWCRLNCHMPVGKQHQKLSLKLRGHCG